MQELVQTFEKAVIKYTTQNIYKDSATWDAAVEGLSNIKHSLSIYGGVHQSEYEISVDGSYDEGAHAVQ